MPVDPTISLGVTGGKSGMADSGYSGSSSNPLAMASSFADTQKKLNENKLFNQTFAAKQRLGQIMAQSPDIPTAIERAQADPSVAAFVPDLLGTIVATQDTMQKYRGQVQAQTADAYTHGLNMLPGEFVAPGSLERNLPAYLNTIPAGPVRDAVAKSMNNVKEGLTSDLPADPEARKQEFMKRLTASALQNPGMLETMKGLWAQPAMVNKGDVQQPVTIQGSIPTIAGRAPGDVQNSGNALQLGLPPGMYGAEGNLAGGKYGPTGAGGGASAPAAAASPDESVGGKIGADGKPLIPEGLSMESPPVDRSSFGVPIGTQAAGIAKMHEKFTGPETEAYQNSGLLLGQLAEMKNNLTDLEKGHGFLSPGSGAEFRLGVAKLGKLVEDVTGADLGVDKSKIANAEDAMKLTQRLGISYLTSALGSQREAAETIRNITEKGIPGIQNTYLGSALMTDMIEAVAKRSMEEHEFRQIWQSKPKNKGNLTNADIEFNKAHPAKDYISQALTKYGIDEKQGTISRAGAEAALAKGLITPAQAEYIRQNKGKIPAGMPKAEPEENK